MDVLIMIVCASIVLGLLVFIHEGGHYLTARMFGVRVTEFMLGLPGPSLSFKAGETRFGVTAIPLGGYARVCGMEPGEMKPHLKEALSALHRRGTAHMEEIAADCGISDDEAYEALEELVEWGSAVAPLKSDKFNTYRTPEFRPTRRSCKKARELGIALPKAYVQGEAREVADEQALFDSEYSRQYRSLPFWKRSVILVAGVVMNLLFAMVVFVILYSVIGFDVQSTETGEIRHIVVDPLRSVAAGFAYIGMVIQAVASLFNPATAAETVSQSTSIMGIAVMSKSAFEQGLTSFLSFSAMISVSLGIMNLLPIPPLDGGRFVIEVIQKLMRRPVSLRTMNAVTMVGMALFLGFFVIMLNQDIQRFIFGNWG